MKHLLLLLVLIFSNTLVYSQTKKEKEAAAYKLIEEGYKSCQESEYKKGIVYYTKALEYNVLKSEIYKKRGGAYFALEDFPNAVADYSAAIAENPEDIADVYFLRGLSKSLLDTEDVVGACEDFRKAKSLGYSMKDLNGLNDYCGDTDLEE